MPRPARNSSPSRALAAVVAFSPDGKRLATRRLAETRGTEVKIWDAQTGQELLTFKGTPACLSVAFSPDGKRLASVSATWITKIYGTVKVWDAQTGQELSQSIKGCEHGGVWPSARTASAWPMLLR